MNAWKWRPFTVALAFAGLAAVPGSALGDSFGPEQRHEIESIIKDYLVKNPDVLLDALQAAEDKVKSDAHDKASAALVGRRRELLDDPASPVAGNPRGDVSLVEFFDYRCPYCKQVEPALGKLVADDRRLRFVYKEFPVLGPVSEVAARAALAARQQSKYEAFHRAMMNAPGHFDETVIYKVAATVGLDIERLKQDMKSPEVDKELKTNLDLGSDLDLSGTPSFIVGDTIVPGAITAEELRQLIATARGKL